jgi:hypothetical protein
VIIYTGDVCSWPLAAAQAAHHRVRYRGLSCRATQCSARQLMTHSCRASQRQWRKIFFSHGAEWKTLISRYMKVMPLSGDACCMAVQKISGAPPSRAINSAMMAKVGVAARQRRSAAMWAADPRLFLNACFEPAGREVMRISDTVVPQRLAVPRSSEYPAFRRGHWTMGRPSVR